MASVPAVETRTGLDLKLARTAARVTQVALAERMGVRPQRVSQIEALAVVRPVLADRYVAALATLAKDAA